MVEFGHMGDCQRPHPKGFVTVCAFSLVAIVVVENRSRHTHLSLVPCIFAILSSYPA